MLIDGESVLILHAAKEQKLKNGQYKMKEQNRLLIEEFIMFDLQSSWMEAKEYTKLGKLLAVAVKIGAEILGDPFMIKNSTVTDTPHDLDTPIQHTYAHGIGAMPGDNILTFTVERQLWNLDEINVDGEEDKMFIRKMIEKVNAVRPIVDHYAAMANRLTRNGKFPREEAERQKRAAIKGKLDKKLAAVLTEIRTDWVKIIYEFELKWMTDVVRTVAQKLTQWNATGVPKESLDYCTYMRMSGIIKHNTTGKGYLICTEDEMKKTAKRNAEDEGDGFFFKMADKLGGLVTGKREFLDAKRELNGNTPFSSIIRFDFASDTKIVLENKIITNHSPRNKAFYQYPCTFIHVTIDGKQLKGPSELSVKQAFLKQ